MIAFKKLINKEQLSKLYTLYSKQQWLIEREDKLEELLILCDTTEHKLLVLELLHGFYYLENKTLNSYLKLIADFIISDSGFDEVTTQVAAFSYDDEADSGQKILDYIKNTLWRQGWGNVKTVNRYGRVAKNFNEGRKQIIFIDEFVGSGSTVIGRVKQLKSDIREDFELKFCFLAGMDFGIKNIEALGYEVFCPLRMPRGISEIYQNEELELKTNLMLSLETKLSQKVNNFELSTYSFGHGKAEALYSFEGNQGNTPNSVFPVFWWPRKNDEGSRNTLLTRFERGLK